MAPKKRMFVSGFHCCSGLSLSISKTMMMFISTFFSNFIENPYFLGILYIYMYIYINAIPETNRKSALGNRPPKLPQHQKGHQGAYPTHYTPKNKQLEPKNKGLEYESPFQRSEFQVPAVCFGGSRWWILMILFFSPRSIWRVFSGFSKNHPIIRGIKPPGISSMFIADLTLFIKAWQPGN